MVDFAVLIDISDTRISDRLPVFIAKRGKGPSVEILMTDVAIGPDLITSRAVTTELVGRHPVQRVCISWSYWSYTLFAF